MSYSTRTVAFTLTHIVCLNMYVHKFIYICNDSI